MLWGSSFSAVNSGRSAVVDGIGEGVGVFVGPTGEMEGVGVLEIETEPLGDGDDVVEAEKDGELEGVLLGLECSGDAKGV